MLRWEGRKRKSSRSRLFVEHPETKGAMTARNVRAGAPYRHGLPDDPASGAGEDVRSLPGAALQAGPLRGRSSEGRPIALFECMIEPESGLYLSEDYAFCRRWRDLGGEVWLDIKSRLTHYGPNAFKGDLAQQFTRVTRAESRCAMTKGSGVARRNPRGRPLSRWRTDHRRQRRKAAEIWRAVLDESKTPWPKYHRQSFGNLPCIHPSTIGGAYDDEQNYTRFCTGHHRHCDEHSGFGKPKAGSYSFSFLFFDFVRL